MRFLTSRYIKKLNQDEMMDISTYALLCFENYTCFESWWDIQNLGLNGLSPSVLATQENGLKKIAYHLISVAHQNGHWI